MQWLLQQFEDTSRLAQALDRLGIAYTWHKVTPFSGDLLPTPKVDDPSSVILFGSYEVFTHDEHKEYNQVEYTTAAGNVEVKDSYDWMTSADIWHRIIYFFKLHIF